MLLLTLRSGFDLFQTNKKKKQNKNKSTKTQRMTRIIARIIIIIWIINNMENIRKNLYIKSQLKQPKTHQWMDWPLTLNLPVAYKHNTKTIHFHFSASLMFFWFNITFVFGSFFKYTRAFFFPYTFGDLNFIH